jgi:hypothetical protein
VIRFNIWGLPFLSWGDQSFQSFYCRPGLYYFNACAIAGQRLCKRANPLQVSNLGGLRVVQFIYVKNVAKLHTWYSGEELIGEFLAVFMELQTDSI